MNPLAYLDSRISVLETELLTLKEVRRRIAGAPEPKPPVRFADYQPPPPKPDRRFVEPAPRPPPSAAPRPPMALAGHPSAEPPAPLLTLSDFVLAELTDGRDHDVGAIARKAVDKRLTSLPGSVSATVSKLIGLGKIERIARGEIRLPRPACSKCARVGCAGCEGEKIEGPAAAT